METLTPKLIASTAVIIGLLGALPVSVDSQTGGLPVFPGAQGFGTNTVAGRRGTVYRVINLNDSGAGSLREAVSASGPRVVIFELSGTIVLKSTLAIASPYVTIAGQTAPSPGITLRGATLRLQTHDVLIQHLRIRVGDDGLVTNPDGLWVNTGAYNIVIDHVSASWGIDENMSTSVAAGNVVRDVTFSHVVISEGLSNSLNTKGEHSKGVLNYIGSQRVSIVRSLFAHNRERNPAVSANSAVVIANTLNYNPGNAKGAIYLSNAEGKTEPHLATVVGNVLVPGPSTLNSSSLRLLWARTDLIAPTSKIFVDDNRGPSYSAADRWSVTGGGADPFKTAIPDSFRSSIPPVSVPGLTMLPSDQVETYVLQRAGARPADRDAVDERIVTEVKNRTGRIIDSPKEVGGWPTLAVNRRTLTLPNDPQGDDDGDGYTNLEEWLHAYAANVEGKGMTSNQPPSAPTNVRVTN